MKKFLLAFAFIFMFAGGSYAESVKGIPLKDTCSVEGISSAEPSHSVKGIPIGSTNCGIANDLRSFPNLQFLFLPREARKTINGTGISELNGLSDNAYVFNQPTANTQFNYAVNCINDQPCAEGDSTDSRYFESTDITNVSKPWHLWIVWSAEDSDVNHAIGTAGAGSFDGLYKWSDGVIYSQWGSGFLSYSKGATFTPMLTTVVATSMTEGYMYENGVLKDNTPSANLTVDWDTVVIGANADAFATPLNGKIGIAVLYSGSPSDSTFNSIGRIITNYFRFSWSDK